MQNCENVPPLHQTSHCTPSGLSSMHIWPGSLQTSVRTAESKVYTCRQRKTKEGAVYLLPDLADKQSDTLCSELGTSCFVFLLTTLHCGGGGGGGTYMWYQRHSYCKKWKYGMQASSQHNQYCIDLLLVPQRNGQCNQVTRTGMQ